MTKRHNIFSYEHNCIHWVLVMIAVAIYFGLHCVAAVKLWLGVLRRTQCVATILIIDIGERSLLVGNASRKSERKRIVNEWELKETRKIRKGTVDRHGNQMNRSGDRRCRWQERRAASATATATTTTTNTGESCFIDAPHAAERCLFVCCIRKC